MENQTGEQAATTGSASSQIDGWKRSFEPPHTSIPCQAHADNISCSFTAHGPNAGSTAFEIDSFSFGIEQAVNEGSGTGGSVAGRVKFGEFSISKTTDSASPKLFQSVIGGRIFSKVICKLSGEPTDAGAVLSPYLTAELQNVTLDKFQITGNG